MTIFLIDVHRKNAAKHRHQQRFETNWKEESDLKVFFSIVDMDIIRNVLKEIVQNPRIEGIL